MADEPVKRRVVRRRWREFRTAAGKSPVRDFIMEQTIAARVEIAAAMKDVRDNGLIAARHLREDIYEVRAEHANVAYRILFATEGRSSQVLLSLEAFEKKTPRTPPERIDVALKRLREWRERARARRRRKPVA